jgi:crotonobetainyl-CoA:carnitine CoA-transferase CaiB-like acyl-CoA transferase
VKANVDANNKLIGPLSGIRVIDLADEKADFCSKILAELGAEVIKVERPGDPRGPSFSYNNTNKYGLILDWGKHKNKCLLLKLLNNSHIFIETFPPGYLEGFGLGFTQLKKSNPQMIMVSVTGFGQFGPKSHYKTCDLVASAMGGHMAATGSPSRSPLKVYGEQSYFIASLYAAVGILLALHQRDVTGLGTHIDISLQEAVASSLEHVMVRYFYDETVTKRSGSRYWNDSFRLMRCKNGFICISPFLEWDSLVDLMDMEGMAADLKDAKWRDEAYRTRRALHVFGIMENWTQTHTKETLFKLGQRIRLPWSPVQAPKDILACPQLRSRQFFIPYQGVGDTALGEVYPGVPYKWFPSFVSPRRQAPRKGEHQRRIFRQIAEGTFQEIEKPEVPKRKLPKERKNNGILSGVRVVDFSRVLAGPYASRILADFGAEVIKVQSSKTAQGAENNTSAYFQAWNRNKYGITLDMSHPEAIPIALKLIGFSDVVLENFSPRVMNNWGLNFENLTAVKKDLIMVRMSAMGLTGPWRDFAAYGPTIHALCGITYLTSYGPEKPVGPGFSYADIISGLYTAIIILAALKQRDRTGQGQCIDLSEYEAACTAIGPCLIDAVKADENIIPAGNHSPYVDASPYGCYRCQGKDRWCTIAVFNDAEWQALCHTAEHPEWLNDHRFGTFESRRSNEQALNILIGNWTSTAGAEEIVEWLQQSGVPSGIVQNAEDLVKDPHLVKRSLFGKIGYEKNVKTLADRPPMVFDGARAKKKPIGRSAPSLGRHNRYVYMDLLGLTGKEYSYYRKNGVIA